METLVAVIHILVALVLIALILMQDTKSGSVGGAFGGGGSNSILGATGATTLAQKMTRFAAIIFAITSISLTIFSSRAHKSVIDDVVTSPSTPAATAPALPGEGPVSPAPSTDIPNGAPTSPEAAPGK